MSSNTPSDDAEEPVAWMFETDRGPHYFRTEKDALRGASLYGNYVFKPLYLHPPKPAESEAKPVLYIKEQELLYIQVLKQEGLAQEWKSNLGFVKEAGDVGLYLHPPKPAEPARKPMTSEEMMKQYEIDKEYFGESVMRAFYNGIRFAEKHHGIGEA